MRKTTTPGAAPPTPLTASWWGAKTHAAAQQASKARRSLPWALHALCTLVAVADVQGALCDREPVLTPLATDTRDEQSLFSLITGSQPSDRWLLILEARRERALVFPDPLASLRTSASHGPGPFLSAGRCGDDCFQPLQWSATGWESLGYPIEHDPQATLHFTYDTAGAPWLVFHQLTATKGVLNAHAYRWDGTRWADRGRLLIQAVGSPGAGPDPRNPHAIVSGTGRFAAAAEPVFWLPALPALAGSTGGQVLPLAGRSAAFLTFDGQILVTRDGASWQLERWTPWPNPLSRSDLWRPGSDYTLDRPSGESADALALVWTDDRERQRPRLHLTRWLPTEGWLAGPVVATTTESGGAIEHVYRTASGTWLLIGPCRSSGNASWLDSLVARPGSETSAPLRIPLEAGRRN